VILIVVTAGSLSLATTAQAAPVQVAAPIPVGPDPLGIDITPDGKTTSCRERDQRDDGIACGYYRWHGLN
jgi:hypothetical protein